MQWIAKVFSLVAFVFLCSSQNIWARTEVAKQVVRVHIQSLSTKLSLSGINIHFPGLEGPYKPVALPQTRKIEIARVKMAGKNYWQVKQDGGGETPSFFSDHEVLTVQGENLKQGATELPDKLLLQAADSQQVDIIGEIPLEDYVLAVLVNEMPLTWPFETLKAQAVAIRSYTEAILRERENKSFHVESTVLDQVYKKIAVGISPALFQKARRAVEATAGIVLISPKGPVLKAYYHSDCGGKTLPASTVWKQEKDNDAGTAVDEACAYNPHSQWSYTIGKEKLARLLRNAAHIMNDLSLETLELHPLDGGSRIKEILVGWSGNISQIFASNEFRKILGFMDLKSTSFEIYEKEDEVQFIGRGFGHGVGMCQWGSRALGLKGVPYQKILSHYYPLANLKIN